MSKAYLQGFYDYFVNQCSNPYFMGNAYKSQDYHDWEAGWDAGYATRLALIER